eukprot:6192403-Pleurochrysis_carterae.AAC.7
MSTDVHLPVHSSVQPSSPAQRVRGLRLVLVRRHRYAAMLCWVRAVSDRPRLVTDVGRYPARAKSLEDSSFVQIYKRKDVHKAEPGGKRKGQAEETTTAARRGSAVALDLFF